MKGDFGKMMRQMKDMQSQMSKIQDELAEEKVETSAGGGMVKATVSGTQQLLELKIDPEAVDPNDIEMLEDMVVAAVNEALRQSQELAAQKLSRVTGGLGIPGMPGLT